MSTRTRLKYYGQVVSFADAHYFGNILRWWEERQLVLLALVPVKVLQQALLLLWVPVWALLPPDPGGFIASWLALVGIVLAVGVFLNGYPFTNAQKPCFSTGANLAVKNRSCGGS